MKDYLGGLVDLTGDARINPATLDFGDGEGSHGRVVGAITSFSGHHDAMFRPHAYDSVARYVAEAAGDAARLGPGLPYHYRIDNEGTIFHCRPLTVWLNCVGSSENVSTVAICLDGYLHNDNTNQGQDPTREQYESLGQLLKYLCEERPDIPATYPDFRPHLDFSQTACCGNRFAPWVLAVKDKATATAIPASAVYDWPEYQASAPVAPPKPASIPVKTAPATPPPAPPVPVVVAPPARLPVPEPHVTPPVVTAPSSSPVESPKPSPVPSAPPIISPDNNIGASWFAGFVAWLKSILGLK